MASLLRETDDSSKAKTKTEGAQAKRDRNTASKAAEHAITASMRATKAGPITTQFAVSAALAVLDELLASVGKFKRCA